jgi:uncharacterized protein YeaO (DUF488 family)
MNLRTFRIGESARQRGELRIATTRRPPRGVHKTDWGRYFDVWLPAVAPSVDLLARAHRLTLDRPADWKTFERAYTREMSRTEPRQTIALLAALAHRWPIAIGCYCDNESRCHRSILRRLIAASDSD